MSELDNFPEKKERRSKLADLPEPVLSGLDTMYGAFVKELDEIGACVLRGEQYIGARMHALRSRNLRIALRRESGEWLNAHCPSLYQRVRNARASLVERPSPRS